MGPGRAAAHADLAVAETGDPGGGHGTRDGGEARTDDDQTHVPCGLRFPRESGGPLEVELEIYRTLQLRMDGSKLLYRRVIL